MLWVSKLKEGAREVVKEHPVSVWTFFVSCVFLGILSYSYELKFSNTVEDILTLSKPSDTISKFGNIMMGYVFPGILAVAFVIVYIYILKILITWTFPSNEAFTIVTALFAAGICIWTMAQGQIGYQRN